MRRIGIIFAIISGFFALQVTAAIKPISIEPNKIIKYYKKGVFVGGVSGTGYTLYNVKRKAKKKKNRRYERISLVYADKAGERIHEKVGYFHMSLEQKPARLVIDLSQVGSTKINEKQVAQIFKKSKLVKRTVMTIDPEDNSTNLTLYFKRHVKARVSTLVKGKSGGKVFIDLAEIKSKKSKKKSLNKKNDRKKKKSA